MVRITDILRTLCSSDKEFVSIYRGRDGLRVEIELWTRRYISAKEIDEYKEKMSKMGFKLDGVKVGDNEGISLVFVEVYRGD